MECVVKHGLLELVAEYLGTCAEVLDLIVVCRGFYEGTEWEHVFRAFALRRAGRSDARKRGIKDAEGSWRGALRVLGRVVPTHAVDCYVCGRGPVDGALFSCMHCFGPDFVWCESCDADVAAWHPADHITVRWPKSQPPFAPATGHALAGRFAYRKLLWKPKKQAEEQTGSVACAECELELDGIVAQCATCPGHPVLCARCCIGNLDGLRERFPPNTGCAPFVEKVGRLVASVEAATGKKVYTGTRSQPLSEHMTGKHVVTLYPYAQPVEREAGKQHACSCNMCKGGYASAKRPGNTHTHTHKPCTVG